MSRKIKNKPLELKCANTIHNPPGKEKGGKYEIKPIDPRQIPIELRRDFSSWSLWRFYWDFNKKRWTKPPVGFDAFGDEIWIEEGMREFKGGYPLYSFEQALNLMRDHPGFGIGLVLPEKSGYVCLDFDLYRNSLTGKIDDDGIKWLQKFGVHAWNGLSVSGTGWHTWIKANLDKWREYYPGRTCAHHKDKDPDGVKRQIEIFESSRFLVFSGERLKSYGSTEVFDRQDVLDELIEEIVQQEERGSIKVSVPPLEIDRADSELISELLKNEKFASNWYGSFDKGDGSEHAISLINSIGPKTEWDFDRTFTIFSQCRMSQDDPDWFDERRVGRMFENSRKTCKSPIHSLPVLTLQREEEIRIREDYVWDTTDKSYVCSLIDSIADSVENPTDRENFKKIASVVRKLKFDDRDFPFAVIEPLLSDRGEFFANVFDRIWEDCRLGDDLESSLKTLVRREGMKDFGLPPEKTELCLFTTYLYYLQRAKDKLPIELNQKTFARIMYGTESKQGAISEMIKKLKKMKFMEDACSKYRRSTPGQKGFSKTYRFKPNPIDSAPCV